MVLDMAEVHYMNSAGLRTLADILTRNRANGGDLLLVAPNPKVERVFKIIGFVLHLASWIVFAFLLIFFAFRAVIFGAVFPGQSEGSLTQVKSVGAS